MQLIALLVAETGRVAGKHPAVAPPAQACENFFRKQALEKQHSRLATLLGPDVCFTCERTSCSDSLAESYLTFRRSRLSEFSSLYVKHTRAAAHGLPGRP